MSLNRWVFKWRLKVRMFSHSRMSSGIRRVPVDAAATEKRDGPVRCVCEERRASEHRKSAEPEVVHTVHGSVPAR